ncbi:hypothetical protein BT93_F1804 [Corymbia citriodora subsp. variegata]|nr:hypothetical protein BT93_F1804 [Corymbia citriodora subsp. variegata]
MMALKFDKRIYRVTALCALSGLLVGGLISFCLDGSRQIMGKKEGEDSMALAEHFGILLAVAGKSTSHGLFTLGIKSLHFFIAKLLQFRFASPLQPATSTMPLVFWVALSRSISSMSMDH